MTDKKNTPAQTKEITITREKFRAKTIKVITSQKHADKLGPHASLVLTLMGITIAHDLEAAFFPEADEQTSPETEA